MKWSAPANRRVVEAVIATFRDSAERSHQQLSAFKPRDWERSYYWLDASGMALYFLNQLETLGIEGALPGATLDRLRQNLADNHFRSASMFAEFITLNQSFSHAGVRYCNLKGFTLWPDSCPSPALRCQLDLDFLVDGRDLNLCREILAKTGYALTVINGREWQFEAGASELTRIEDHYKPKPQRSVELHFASSPTGTPTRDERLDRLASRSLNGHTFPTLSPAEQFVAQALHLLLHLRSACTRPAWLLEYKRHIAIHGEDRAFWNEVRQRAQAHRNAPIAIGLANLLCEQLFGLQAPAQLDAWTLDRLPAPVRLWADLYGRKAVLADSPGTKLYLLLEDEVAPGNNSWRKKRKSLLPLYCATRITHPAPGDGLLKRLRGQLYQARYLLFRLRFHLSQGLRYLMEATRWRRQLAMLQPYTGRPIAEEAHLTKSQIQ